MAAPPLHAHPTLQHQSTEQVITPNEALLQRVRDVLLKRSTTVREQFTKIDSHSYGYITNQQLRSLLADPALGLNFTEEELDVVVKHADGYKQSDGKVEYGEFFDSFFSASVIQAPGSRKNTLRQIYVVTRHGARFPLKRFPNNTSWPKSDDFWKRYGGKLTPTGQMQHVNLGKKLATRYVRVHGIEPFMTPDNPRFPEEVYVYCGNTDRTLYSAEALLLGMFPNIPHAYVVEGDSGVNLSQNLDAIELVVAKQAHTALLHGFKANPVWDELKTKAFAASPKFAEWAKQPEYEALRKKLWDMTGFEKVAPKIALEKALNKFGGLVTQIAIERAHRMGIFSNDKNVFLEAEDEKRMAAVAAHVCRTRYQGLSDADQHVMARLGAGTLPASVVKHFQDRAAGKSKLKMVLMSAHDNTIMAVLSQLGLRDWPIPGFASNIVFELHEIGNNWMVRVTYDADPSTSTNADVQYIPLPRNGDIVDYDAALKDKKHVFHTLETFAKIVLEERKSFANEAEWLAAARKGFPDYKDEDDGEDD